MKNCKTKNYKGKSLRKNRFKRNEIPKKLQRAKPSKKRSKIEPQLFLTFAREGDVFRFKRKQGANIRPEAKYHCIKIQGAQPSSDHEGTVFKTKTDG
jgi:hypothetical protein